MGLRKNERTSAFFVHMPTYVRTYAHTPRLLSNEVLFSWKKHFPYSVVLVGEVHCPLSVKETPDPPRMHCRGGHLRGPFEGRAPPLKLTYVAICGAIAKPHTQKVYYASATLSKDV